MVCSCSEERGGEEEGKERVSKGAIFRAASPAASPNPPPSAPLGRGECAPEQVVTVSRGTRRGRGRQERRGGGQGERGALCGEHTAPSPSPSPSPRAPHAPPLRTGDSSATQAQDKVCPPLLPAFSVSLTSHNRVGHRLGRRRAGRARGGGRPGGWVGGPLHGASGGREEGRARGVRGKEKVFFSFWRVTRRKGQRCVSFSTTKRPPAGRASLPCLPCGWHTIPVSTERPQPNNNQN